MIIPKFIGKQLSRLKLGQSYYSIMTSTLSTISLIALAFKINVYILIFAFPLILLATFIIGYILDVYNVNTMDNIKTNEIQQRFLNTRDLKIQEFQIIQLKILTEVLKRNKEGFNTDFNEISNKFYQEYYKKWKSN